MNTWDNGLSVTETWVKHLDEETQQEVYYNNKSGDYSRHVPYGFQVFLNKYFTVGSEVLP